jgi:hypothetical protein
VASDGAQTSERTDDNDCTTDADENVGGILTVDRRQFHVHVELHFHPYSKGKDCNSGKLEAKQSHRIDVQKSEYFIVDFSIFGPCIHLRSDT